MRKTTILLSALFVSAFAFAQLNVRHNAYIYVTDEIVYVENNVNLQESNTNFYLRDEAQLIQGSGQSIANSGSGNLSQLEANKENAYGYNAWISPVTFPGAAGGMTNPQEVIFTNTGNTGNGFTTFGNVNYIGAYTPGATPAQTEIASYWLWSYVAGTQYADWVHLQPTASKLEPGHGFLMKGAGFAAGNTARDFRGIPKSDDIVVNVLANQSTLTGNPYPSAIDAQAFIHDTANSPRLLDGNIYYYHHPSSGSHNLTSYNYAYAAYTITPAGSPVTPVETKPDPALYNSDITGDNPGPSIGSVTNTASRYIPISQGFFVTGAANGTITLKNNHRAYIKRSNALSTSGYKNSNFSTSNGAIGVGSENPIIYAEDNGYQVMPEGFKRFRMNVTFVNNQVNRQLIHNFYDGLTNGPDYGYETNSSPVLDTDAYYVDKTDRKLNGIGNTYDIDMKIPFTVDVATDHNINFGLVDIQNFDANQPIFLHDKKTDEYFNLVNNDHQMNLRIGNYTDRFELVFKDNTEVLAVAEEALGSFNIFQNNSIKSLSLINPNTLDVASVTLYDVVGKQVFRSEAMNSNNRFEVSTKNLSDAVYIVKVNFVNGTSTTKKIIVSNKN